MGNLDAAEKPRMMICGSKVHEWTPLCDHEPKCAQLYPDEQAPTPAPKHKLEAGCTVRHKRYITGTGYDEKTGCYDRAEVVAISGREEAIVLTTHGDFLLKDLEVTAPATPEDGDFVWIHESTTCTKGGPTPIEGFIVRDHVGEDWRAGKPDVWDIQTGDCSGHVEEHVRDGFTIIAKARHARERMEGK